ncbi:gdp dissociation inhibitor [Cystoisospora suis]|uniref:Gdp dissociation inhibitor n=1 Tax=Cystoisospora suis TaxID=483139 RepID=A0A2C6L4B6_9APIC|nr:gdp dissociation inhibitor [Cystoisospora suis]
MTDQTDLSGNFSSSLSCSSSSSPTSSSASSSSENSSPSPSSFSSHSSSSCRSSCSSLRSSSSSSSSSLPLVSDVLIVGTGLTACMCAASLARYGAQVIQIDEGDNYGSPYQSLKFHELLHLFSSHEEQEDEAKEKNTIKPFKETSCRSSPRSSATSSASFLDTDSVHPLPSHTPGRHHASSLSSTPSIHSSSPACTKVVGTALSPMKESLSHAETSSLATKKKQERKIFSDEEQKRKLSCEETSFGTGRRCYLTWREDEEKGQGKLSSFSLSVESCRKKIKEKDREEDEEEEEEVCSLAMCMMASERRRRVTSSPRSYLFRSFTSRSFCFFPFMKKRMRRTRTKTDGWRDGEDDKDEGKRRREGGQDDEEGEENSKKERDKEINGSFHAPSETSVSSFPPGEVYVHPDHSPSVGDETASKKSKGTTHFSTPNHTSDRREEDDEDSYTSVKEEEDQFSWMKREEDLLSQRRISNGFSIDLLPRFLYSSSNVVDILVHCGGSRYLEFRPIAAPVFVAEVDGEEEEESEKDETEKEEGEEEDHLHAGEGKELSTSMMIGENKKEKEMKGREEEEGKGERCLDEEMKMKKSRGFFPEKMFFSLTRASKEDHSKMMSTQDQVGIERKEQNRIDLEPIPLSRSAIFSSGVLTLREKRLLMKFISGVASQYLSPLFLSAAHSWRREDRGKTEKKSHSSIEEGEEEKCIQAEKEKHKKKIGVSSSSSIQSSFTVVPSSQEKKVVCDDDEKQEKDSRSLNPRYTNNEEEEKKEREKKEEQEEKGKRKCPQISWKGYLDEQNLTEKLQRYLTFGLCLCESPLSFGGACASLNCKKGKEALTRETKKLVCATEAKEEEGRCCSLERRRDDGIGEGFQDANEGQKRLELFIRSLGVYGHQQTPRGGGGGGGGVYLYPLFGAGDFCQAFSRVASLSEAIYMLRAGITSIQISSSSSLTARRKDDKGEIERKEEKEKEGEDDDAFSCEGRSEDFVKMKRQEDQEKREDVVRKKNIPNLSDLCLLERNTSPIRVYLTNGECIQTRLLLFEADTLPPLDTPVKISEKGAAKHDKEKGKKDEEEEPKKKKNGKRGRDDEDGQDVCGSSHSIDCKERREYIVTRSLGEILFGGVSSSLGEDEEEEEKKKKKKRRKMDAGEETEKGDLDPHPNEHMKGISEGSDEKQGALQERSSGGRKKTIEEEEDGRRISVRATNDEEVSMQGSPSPDKEEEEKKDEEESEKGEDDRRENSRDMRCSCHLVAICRQPVLKGKGFRLCVCTVRKRVGDRNKKKRITSSRDILDLSFSTERDNSATPEIQWPVHILQTDCTCGTAPQGYTLLHLSHVCTPGDEVCGCTNTASVYGCSPLKVFTSTTRDISRKRSKEEKRGRRPCRMLWCVFKRLLFSSYKRDDDMRERKENEAHQRQFSVERDCIFTCSYLFKPSGQTSYEREWLDRGVGVLARYEGVFRDIVLRNARKKKENALFSMRNDGREDREIIDTERREKNEEKEELCMDRREEKGDERRNEKDNRIDELCSQRNESSDGREMQGDYRTGCVILPPPPVVPLYTLLREPENCLHVISTLLGQPELSIEDLIPQHVRQGLDDAEAQRQFLTAPYEQLDKLVEEKEEDR